MKRRIGPFPGGARVKAQRLLAMWIATASVKNANHLGSLELLESIKQLLDLPLTLDRETDQVCMRELPHRLECGVTTVTGAAFGVRRCVSICRRGQPVADIVINQGRASLPAHPQVRRRLRPFLEHELDRRSARRVEDVARGQFALMPCGVLECSGVERCQTCAFQIVTIMSLQRHAATIPAYRISRWRIDFSRSRTNSGNICAEARSRRSGIRWRSM